MLHKVIIILLWKTLSMALYKYFKKASVLPNPDGPFSARILTSAIKTAKPLLNNPGSTAKQAGKRGQYLVYTDEEKYKIGKRAAEMGVTNTLRFYQKQFADRPLKKARCELGQRNIRKSWH